MSGNVPSFSHLAEMSEPITFAPARDAAGREWIARLPALVLSICRRWGLEIESATVYSGYSGIVVLVSRRGEPLALKLTWPPEGMAKEARGLVAWNGRGVVQMVEVDVELGAVLLERLDPARTLHNLPPIDAAFAAGTLLRRLAIPAPPGFRDLRRRVAETRCLLEEWQQRPGSSVLAEWLKEAIELAGTFERYAATDRLIHADLHYDNILAGTREPWLAIDPRPLAGEPECAVAELMWTRVDEVEGDAGVRDLLRAIVQGGALDARKARDWVVVRCVDYWLWGIQHGLTHDPRRCRRVLEAIL